MGKKAKITKRIKDSITEKDLFGHQIQFNFNRKGTSHNTLCGGLVSMGIKTLIFCYTILNIKKLVNYEDDKYISVTWATNSTYLGEVDMSKTDVFAIELAKAREETSLRYYEEARRYVRAYAYNKKWGKDESS